MTLEEKRKAIEEYCDDVKDCLKCKSKHANPARCFGYFATDAMIEDNYSRIFAGEKKDAVHHPDHYQGKHECIEEMIALFGIDAVISFCKCNIYKYRFRADKKNGEQDIQKAENYVDILMDLQKRKEKEA